jgi:hypothetical protein
MSKLTPAQQQVMYSLNSRVGQTVEVLTSEYTAAVNPDYVKRAIFLGTVSSATLRGLETKGFIRIVETYWRGAMLEVLKESVA